MTQFDPKIAEGLREASQLMQWGNLTAARKRAENLLAYNPHVAVLAYLGIICCQMADFKAGARYFGEALLKNPDDIAMRVNLVTALVDAGDNDAALTHCTAEAAARDPSARLGRFRGFLLQRNEDYAAAAHAYEQVVQAYPDDFDSWNNLGNARAALDDHEGSIKALQRAVELRPDVSPTRLNLVSAMIDANRIDEALAQLEACVRDFPKDSKPLVEYAGLLRVLDRFEDAVAALEKATALEPDDADIHTRLGATRIEANTTEQAEHDFLAALKLDPKHSEALIQLAMYYDYHNRVDDLRALKASLNTRQVDMDTANFVAALFCRRDQNFEEGLRLLAELNETTVPVRRYQLEGEFRERLGDAHGAYTAFTKVNALLLEEPTNPIERAKTYRESIKHDRTAVTKPWFDSWSKCDRPIVQKSPVFLLGFPRSGTTLLDTMLMGHPDIQVMEELPPLRVVERHIGGIEKLPSFTEDELDKARALYFDEVSQAMDYDPAKVLVDKFPLHLNKVPLIHRLFPEAKFILALRHPCDVVLSCYITSFRLNNAMANFLTLENAAKVYDMSFDFWSHCRALMPITVHEVRYENMVADVEAELRPVFDYIGCDWHPAAKEHQATAAGRGRIGTASYSQVTEPIYRRAIARWARYSDYIEPIMPMLKPWVESFGYTL
jgi:tetratricopeptide (TPR) repeat protein